MKLKVKQAITGKHYVDFTPLENGIEKGKSIIYFPHHGIHGTFGEIPTSNIAQDKTVGEVDYDIKTKKLDILKLVEITRGE